MVETDVWFALIGALLIVTPLLLVYYLQYRRYQRSTPYLLQVFLAMLFASILMVFSIAFSDNPEISMKLSVVAELAGILIPFLFYMHFQSLVSLRPPARRFSIIFGLTVMVITLHIPELFSHIVRTDPDYSRYFIFLGVIQLLQALLSLYYSMIIAYKNYQISNNIPTRNEFIAMILIFLTFPGIAVEFILDHSFLAIPAFIMIPVTFLPSAFGLIGFLLYFINYFMNLDYLYAVPIKIQSIIFYNNSGLPRYKKMVQTDSQISEVLLSGAFTAISAVLQESMNEKVALTHIDLGLYNVFFGHIEDLGTITLICEEGSSFFVNSIDRFVVRMPSKLKSLLADEAIDHLTLENEMETYLFDMFPFLKAMEFD
ncbi:MAG: hypothetical protein INQ03_25565 [Candidatus Heimdallarchaeota archaeon]|nr:hypothetical protein [Candidatus Heimdallarchaeota archaeon]